MTCHRVLQDVNDVIDDPTQHRLELEHEGVTAELVYRVRNGRLVLVHTGVPDELEGHGIGGRLVRAALDKAVAKAKDDVAKVAGKERSFLGLEEPLFTLKNPGIISIPLGFLAVLLGSLLFRDRRSEELWPEVYARQNTGILASKAAAH